MSVAVTAESRPLSEGWRWVRLGEIATYANGRAFKPEEWQKVGVPIIRIENLNSPEAPHNYYQGEIDPRHQVTEGDLLVSWSASLDAYVWTGNSAALNQHIFKVMEQPRLVSREYLYFTLRQVMSEIRSQVHGSTMQHITKPEFEATLVPLPPLPEQRRIAAMLTEQMAAVNKAREAVQAQLEAARALPGAYLREVFPESGEPLPEGWRWVRTADVGEVKLGRQRSPKDHYGEHMRPYLRVANVFEDRIDPSDVLSMNFTPEEFETYRLVYGDILLNEGQSIDLVGRPAMYRDELPDGCFQNTLVRYRPFKALLPEFALMVFRANLHAGRFQQIAKRTVNIAHLGAERLAGMDFPLAPLSEQRRIINTLTDRLVSVRSVTDTLESTLEAVDALPSALLSQALQGGN